jgi:hypothetical protein
MKAARRNGIYSISERSKESLAGTRRRVVLQTVIGGLKKMFGNDGMLTGKLIGNTRLAVYLGGE